MNVPNVVLKKLNIMMINFLADIVDYLFAVLEENK